MAALVAICVMVVAVSTVDVDPLGATPTSQSEMVNSSGGFTSAPVLVLVLVLSLLLVAGATYRRRAA